MYGITIIIYRMMAIGKRIERPDLAEPGPVLRGFNPWWHGEPVTVPEFRRPAGEAARALLEDASLRRAVLLSGLRRVGKSTILMQAAADLLRTGTEPKSVLYLSLDHPLLSARPLREILLLYHETVYPERQPATLLLDEVQFSPEWQVEVKLLVDRRPEYRILATGSSGAQHRDRLAESGVGRWVTVPAAPLSLYEFAHIHGAEPEPELPAIRSLEELAGLGDGARAELAARLRPLQLLFQRYLLVGGFPETAARSDDIALCQKLLREDVVDRMLKRDLSALFGVRKLGELERLFLYLCAHGGGILAQQTCAQALGVARATVAQYLDFLVQSNLVCRLLPSAASGKEILKGRSKYYLTDAALGNAMLLRREGIFQHAAEVGWVAETAVLRHLYPCRQRAEAEVGYWREAAADREVDLVLRRDDWSLPVEIKYRERPRLEPGGGLAAYCRARSPALALIVTRRERDFGAEQLAGAATRALKIPAHILCYLLGRAERRGDDGFMLPGGA